MAADIAAATAARADWTAALATRDYATIHANPDLMARAPARVLARALARVLARVLARALARALASAEPLFGENSQAFNGAGGLGGPGFTRLSDDIWLWGSTAGEIEVTLRYGILEPLPALEARHRPSDRFARGLPQTAAPDGAGCVLLGHAARPV